MSGILNGRNFALQTQRDTHRLERYYTLYIIYSLSDDDHLEKNIKVFLRASERHRHALAGKEPAAVAATKTIV